MTNPNVIGILDRVGSIILVAVLAFSLFANISLKREVRELEKRVETLESVLKIVLEGKRSALEETMKKATR